MAERARGTVAVARGASGARVGSGVLIARDLVLTCRHLTEKSGGSRPRRAATDLEVQIQHAGEGGTLEFRTYPVLEYAHTSDRLDLCILRLDADEHGCLPEPDRVRRLSLQRVAPGGAIFVVHHPLGKRLQIADGGHAVFPFCVTADELAAIVARTRASARSGPEGERLAREILLSYRSTDGRVFRNFSRRWAGQPVLGADCMTMDGSSGAPVYDKQTHELVGIVFAGVDQARASIPSYWEHHEAILPAAAILEELARSPCPELRRIAAAAGVGAPAATR
jgi:hypothetical protein